MIIWHIVAYLFIVAANILVFLELENPVQYEITTICGLAINLACTIILALIVNTICTKFLEKMLVAGGSVLQSYILPGSSIQSDAIRTESNYYGGQSDLSSRSLS